MDFIISLVEGLDQFLDSRLSSFGKKKSVKYADGHFDSRQLESPGYISVGFSIKDFHPWPGVMVR